MRKYKQFFRGAFFKKKYKKFFYEKVLRGGVESELGHCIIHYSQHYF